MGILASFCNPLEILIQNSYLVNIIFGDSRKYYTEICNYKDSYYQLEKMLYIHINSSFLLSLAFFLYNKNS